MKRTILILSITFLAIFGTFAEGFAQEKRAQTTMKFLSTPLDARAAGMADAQTALQLGAAAMFYNPASMAQMEDKVNVTAGHLQ